MCCSGECVEDSHAAAGFRGVGSFTQVVTLEVTGIGSWALQAVGDL